MTDRDRRQFLRLALGGAGLTFAGSAAGRRGRDVRPVGRGTDSGLVTVTVDDSVADTVDRLTTTIEDNENLTLLTTVDHASNAESVDLDLPPTTLLVFGNPQLGTPLMQTARSVAIDLPQKLLVWEADDGSTRITYNAPAWLADRHGIDGQTAVLETMATALNGLATGE